MTKVDLITGFLGAGKTTFLLHYAGYLLRQNMRIAVLVYDHGSVNVDLPLLRELQGDRCELEMLAGSCDPDCHRRRFRTKLISLGMRGFDRVLIEPSGVFDMDEYFDTLSDSPLDKWFEPGSVITVVDGQLEDTLSEEEDFYLASQAAAAGCVLLSRVQLATEEELAAAVRHLNRACAAISAASPGSRILAKDWALFTDSDYRFFLQCGYNSVDYIKTVAGHRTSFQSLSFLDLPLGRSELQDRVALLFSDPIYGRVLRVKGFFNEDGLSYQLNATEKDLCMEQVPDSRSVITVIGSELHEDAVNVLLTGQRPEHRILD